MIMLQPPPLLKWGGGVRSWAKFIGSPPDFRVTISDGIDHISPARKTRFEFEHTFSHPNEQSWRKTLFCADVTKKLSSLQSFVACLMAWLWACFYLWQSRFERATRSLRLFARTVHSAHSLRFAMLACSIYGLAHSLRSLPRGTVEIHESVFTLWSQSTGTNVIFVVTRNTPFVSQ